MDRVISVNSTFKCSSPNWNGKYGTPECEQFLLLKTKVALGRWGWNLAYKETCPLVLADDNLVFAFLFPRGLWDSFRVKTRCKCCAGDLTEKQGDGKMKSCPFHACKPSVASQFL